MTDGWKCPGCTRCYAPHVDRCSECGPKREDFGAWVNRLGGGSISTPVIGGTTYGRYTCAVCGADSSSVDHTCAQPS